MVAAIKIVRARPSLDFFHENLGAVSDDHRQSFHLHHGKAVPKQVESQYAGWRLLDT